jgi:hypothetical protein
VGIILSLDKSEVLYWVARTVTRTGFPCKLACLIIHGTRPDIDKRNGKLSNTIHKSSLYVIAIKNYKFAVLLSLKSISDTYTKFND